MSASREEALSPDELRKRLYQTFKSKGLLDTLKTQLRNQLIQELKHPPLTEGKSSVKSDSGLATVCNSIVADYLRNSGYEYSLSVFNPECGLSKDKMLTKEDILQFVKIAPESSLYKALLAQENCDKSFLMSLLTQLSHTSTQEGNDVVTQTTNISSYGESLVEKMKMIDMEYDKHTCRGNTFFTLQSKLDSYKKKIEERLQDEMKIKLQHFKDVEVAKVKMEEQAKFNKEMVKLKHELEETYEMKAKALTEREKNAIVRLQKQQEIEEKNVYMQRQEVLKEIETVRNRESELRIRMEAFQKNCQIHEEKVKTTVELLRRREVAVKTLEDTHDQRLRNEISRYQLELKEEFVKRTEKLTENETRNKMETERLLKESAELDAKLEEHVRACSEIKELKIELNMAQQQQSILTEQKELLKEKLETMNDYTSLKSERVELQGQLRLLGKQLEEALEENSHLRADLQRIQSARRQAEEDWDKQKQVLQAQLQSEVEHSAQLRAHLMESEEKAKWMNNHVDDIKMQLQQTQQALENEVLRNPKPSLVDRSILEICSDHLVPPDIYVDRTVLKNTAHYDLSKADGSLQGDTWANAFESDMDLIADAKARMLELQREAETIEEAYRNYQQRAVVSNISHMLIRRPLSPQYPAPRADSPLRRPHRVVSPKATRTPSVTSYDTRKSSEIQPKVTFLENPAGTLPSGFLAGHDAHQLTETLYERDQHFGDVRPIPARRTSLPQESPTRNNSQKVTEGPLTALVEDALLSNPKAVPSDDFLSELSPPLSPQLRSTARDTASPPKLKPAFSSSESSPQPEKITLEDLTEPLPEQSHIPELLLDTGVPEGLTVPRLQSPQHLQQNPPPATQSPEDLQSSRKPSVAEQEDDGEQTWERERKERQEQRLREQEEARERELQELERLEKEHLLQEEDQAATEEEGNIPDI
ncbi:centriole and centriolar satellite protein ofd1-like [Boleophthalmus pectinirostris]|uniref:centriole and centriolar satellite protein ofd1-like n=1 Tax=Boleophthalmus pectinirostris TaxID=150288 RepID=UPI0024305FEC|nr:centriole and centriolar satellite protein ofd1-like [Boleophthalmus pectinirostris]